MTRFLKYLTIATALVVVWPASADVVDIEDDYLIHANSTAYVNVCEHTFAGGEFPNAARAGLKTLLIWHNNSGSSRYFHLKVTVQPNGGSEDTLYEDFSGTKASSTADWVLPLDAWVTTNLNPVGTRIPYFFGHYLMSVTNADADGDISLRTGTSAVEFGDASIAAWSFANPWTMRVYVKHSAAHASLTFMRKNCGWHVE